MPIKTIFPAPHDGRAGLPVDIVAVHGLDENANTAWTHEENGCFWLRDLLPVERSINARVLTLEYKADSTSFFGSSSGDRIMHHAQTLVEELNAEREHDGTIRRPIIFICHGLGGIIVKKALIYSSMSTSSKITHLHSIFTSTFGLIFFGTPHEGLEKANWSLLARGLKGILKDRSNLLAAVEKNSETLQNVTEQFAPLLKHFHIHNFWETVETSRALTKGYIVTTSSAAPAWNDTSRSGLPATHSGMCKFRDRSDPGYKAICGILQRFHKIAGPTVSVRSKQAEEFLASQRQFEATEILAFDVHKGNEPFNLRLESAVEVENKHYIVPFEVSRDYTGREKLALGLQERLLAPLAQQKRFVLYGLGGSGKTQFCLKFASDNKQRFWGVFWVNASSQETAEQAFCDLARMEQLEEKFESGLHWLSMQKLPWLLVIDNANDATLDYARYFPSGGKGHILVTSRNPDCKVHATIGFEEFVSLEETDAITLLLRSAFVGDPSDLALRRSALPIVKALGCLPLAVIQAGASIRQNICSLEDYLDIFNSYKRMLFSNEPQQGKGSYAYTIFTTFEVSFNEISRLGTQEARDAIEMLQFIAFLHYDQIPEVLFEKAWENMLGYAHQGSEITLAWVIQIFGDLVTISTSYWGWLTFLADGRLPQIFSQSGKRWDKVRFRKAIFLLRSYSLIFQNIVKGSYSMHPMVQFWARERLRPRAQKLWGNMAAKILAEGITMTTNEADVVYRRHLIPHIDSCLKIDSVDSRQGLEFENASIRQFTKFAALYSEGGRWPEASNIQERLLQNRRRNLGKDCNEVLDIMSSLSQSYWNASEIQKALKIQTMLLDLCNDKLGPFDPKTLQAMDMLGRTRWLCGSISEANELGKQAYESSIKILGVDHPLSLSAMHNYGRARLHMGSFKLSQDLLMKAWEGRIKLLGETHLSTLETMQDLAMSCLALKEVEEAASLVSFVLDARKRLLGPEHAHTLWSINDLSKVYCAQGYPGDAVELLIPTREIASRTLGTTHIGTTMTVFNLAHSYTLMGELGQAEAILTELIQTETKYLPPNHPDVYSAKIELAIVLKKRGLLRKAERVSQEALEGRIATFGVDNPRTVQARQLNAEISQGIGLLTNGEPNQRDDLLSS